MEEMFESEDSELVSFASNLEPLIDPKIKLELFIETKNRQEKPLHFAIHFNSFNINRKEAANLMVMLHNFKGVVDVECAREKSKYLVKGDFNSENLLEELRSEGYKLKQMVPRSEVEEGYEIVELKICGMTCSSCSAIIENFLTKEIPGVKKASINYLIGSGEVKYNPLLVSKDRICEAVSQVGFEASVMEKSDPRILQLDIEGSFSPYIPV